MGDEDDDDVDDLSDLWDTFTQRWEQEFRRLSEAEDAQIRHISEEVHRLAVDKAQAFAAAVEAAVVDSDAAAHHISQVSGEMVEAQRVHAVRQVHDDAAHSRCEAAHSALRESEDMAREIMEGAAQRRREREAKRREEKRARDAELEAKRREWQQAESGSAGASRPAPQRPSEPPKTTRMPGAEAAAVSKGMRAKSKVLDSYEAFETAWLAFEQLLRNDGGAASAGLGFADVPWPTALPTVSGVMLADPPRERKRKLRAAVLRWHPDKWAPVLARVRGDERAAVVEKVQEVTRKILDERKRYGQ